MLTYVLIAVGGALGSVLRAWLGAALLGWTGPAFPWGTILINVSGSFAIGAVAAQTTANAQIPAQAELRAFLMVGLCGGFTTFSSFSLQTLDLLRGGRPAAALGNVVLSVALCLLGVAAGYAVGVSART